MKVGRARGRVTVRDQRGDAVVVWCVLMAVLLLPLAGLSVDLWRAIALQRHLASAAEDSATAGASGIDVSYYRRTGCVRLGSEAVVLAEQNLDQQVGLPAGVRASVTVTAGGGHVVVTLSDRMHLSLLALVEGDKPLLVNATAASGPHRSGAAGACS